jgi:hypothetical protein
MNNSEMLIYQNADGKVRLDVRLEGETVWLTQMPMAELFWKSKKTISEHINNIFGEGELDENSVVRKFRTTAADGKNYDVQHYSPDVIISAYLNFVENRMVWQLLITMEDWIRFFHSFLELSNYPIPEDKGIKSHKGEVRAWH